LADEFGETGNIVILGIIGAGAFAYFRLTQQEHLQAQQAAKKTAFNHSFSGLM